MMLLSPLSPNVMSAGGGATRRVGGAVSGRLPRPVIVAAAGASCAIKLSAAVALGTVQARPRAIRPLNEPLAAAP